MVNPHWDEDNNNFPTSGPPGLSPHPWSPLGEYGQHGEFSGSRREEVLPSPNMPGSYRGGPEGWGNYPADEFTGIETLKKNPWDFGRGDFGRKALRGIPSSAISGNRRGPGPWNDFSVGYDRDYTGPWIDNSYGMMDNDMMDEIMMAKIYQSGDPGMINKGSWGSFMPGGDPFWDEVSPQGEAINTILNMPGMEGMRQGSVDDWNYKDFREKVPQYLWDQLPEGAFETLSDFRNQQPITVI